MLDAETCESGLTHRLELISMSSPVMQSSVSDQSANLTMLSSDAVSAMLTAEIQFRILARVLEFLSANAAMLPSKQVLLDALSKAIDAAFTALNKPLISALLKPAVKAQLLAIVGDFYDRIVTPKPAV